MKPLPLHNNFLSELDVRYIDGGVWQVLSEFVYRTNANVDEFVHVPVGFLTDFASIPRAIGAILRSPGGRWDKPAVIHDMLYKCGSISNDATKTHRPVTRVEADRFLLEAMEMTDTHWLARRIIYRGVRVGGWVPWGRYRSDDRKAGL